MAERFELEDFEKIFQQYRDKVFKTAYLIVGNVQEAEDILQESFIKAYNKLDTFRGESNLYSWLKRIAINTALNTLRSKVQMTPLAEYDQGVQEEIWEEVSQLNFEELLQMIQELPSGCRAVFNLMAIEGYKHEEIAKDLGISVGTSKSQFARAKYLLQQKLKTEELRSHG